MLAINIHPNAGKTLDPSKLVIVVVGQAAKVRAGLEKIAPVTVIAAPTPASAPASTPASAAAAEKN